MSLRIGILTVSDRSSRGERADTSGHALQAVIAGQGWVVARSGIVPDQLTAIQETLIEWVDSGQVDVILTTGGTGFSQRDVTPEATLAVLERGAPGLAEAMRAASLKFTSHAMLSRAVCGIRSQVLLVNLPGSPKAAVENLEIIIPALPHAVQLSGPVPAWRTLRAV